MQRISLHSRPCKAPSERSGRGAAYFFWPARRRRRRNGLAVRLLFRIAQTMRREDENHHHQTRAHRLYCDERRGDQADQMTTLIIRVEGRAGVSLRGCRPVSPTTPALCRSEPSPLASGLQTSSSIVLLALSHAPRVGHEHGQSCPLQ